MNWKKVEFFKFDRLLAAGSRGCFTPGSVYGARCRHSGRPRWLPRSRSGHAVPLSPPVPMCCKGKSGLKEGGAVFERITARREREYFSRENAQASCCQGCPPPRAPEERGLLLSQGGVNLYSGTILCSAFWGRGCMLGPRVGPGSESHGEERSGAKVSWTELTGALFRWSSV